MRTYTQALEYLNSFTNYERQRPPVYSAETLNLDRMRNLLARFGSPQQAYPSIHIAGTKGKGSTSAMIESILRAAGYRTALYTSPHLHTFRERMRVSGEPIPRETFAALVDELEPHIASIAGITWFEAMTALGFLHFARSKIDIGVIEVGLGGRFDATNTITPLVSVITSLSMDHMAWLGDTLEKIAFEKAGIIKPGVPAISAPQKPAALAVLERVATERRSPLTVIGRDVMVQRLASSFEGQDFEIGSHHRLTLSRVHSEGDESAFRIPLLGEHQVVNAAVAVTAIDVASACWKPIGIEHVQSGLRVVEWLGRLEIARRNPPLIFDCAHNADSAEKLAASLADLFPGLRWTLVFGASVDKDIAAMLDALLPHADRLIVTQSDSVRASQADQIAHMAMECKRPVETTSSVKEAVERAIDTGAPVIITGSIFVVAEAREAWFEHIGAPVPERDS